MLTVSRDASEVRGAGARLLREWSKKTGSTQMALSEATGIPQSLLSKYFVGRQRPQVDNALAIERATNGSVPVEAWEGWQPEKKRTQRQKRKAS